MKGVLNVSYLIFHWLIYQTNDAFKLKFQTRLFIITIYCYFFQNGVVGPNLMIFSYSIFIQSLAVKDKS